MMTRIGKTSSKSRRAAGCVTGPAADPITWSACCLLVALHDHARRRRRTIIMNRSKPLRYVSKSNTPGSHRRRAPGARVRSSPAAPCCGPAQARARCMHTGLVDRFLERRRQAPDIISLDRGNCRKWGFKSGTRIGRVGLGRLGRGLCVGREHGVDSKAERSFGRKTRAGRSGRTAPVAGIGPDVARSSPGPCGPCIVGGLVSSSLVGWNGSLNSLGHSGIQHPCCDATGSGDETS
jgi:hypothetical protein